MTRRTWVYDSELDAMIQIRGPGSNYFEERSKLQIIRDIEPYHAAGADIACDNKRPVISGRRQHREFLKRNGYVEVGNETTGFGEKPGMSRDARISDLRRAMGDPGGIYDKR